MAATALTVSGLIIAASAQNLERAIRGVAENLFARKVAGDLASLEQHIRFYFGKVLLVDGRLVDRNLNPIESRDQMCQAVLRELGSASALFLRRGEEFVPVIASTAEGGARAAQGPLGPSSPAYAAVSAGERYGAYLAIGPERYYGMYGPLLDEDGERIGLLFAAAPAAAVEEAVGHNLRRSMLWLSAIGAAIAAGTILASALVLRGSMAPLAALTSSLGEMAEGRGDLTKTISVRTEDEIGGAAASLNAFVSSLRSLVIRIKAVAQELERSDSALAQDSKDVADRLAAISSGIDGFGSGLANHGRELALAVAAASEVSESIARLDDRHNEEEKAISQSAAAMEEMIANVASSAENVERNARRFGELVSAASADREFQDRASDAVQRIAENSERLLEANEIIASIAASTDLLAMNAAIEAAHAGEAGRGFSIVADEIRRLAETSKAQSEGIKYIVRGIVDLIGEVASSSGESAKGFDRVVSLIAEIEGAEEELRGSTVEQRAASEQVLGALGAMREISASVGADSSRILGSARSAAQRMEELGRVAKGLTESMESIGRAAQGIEAAAADLISLRARSGSGVAELRSVADSFSV